ncbi:MAG: hypothetical protein M1837_006971 [Sclerophora amabilis]|nr:MAG: hypothetical protein M1837_006971 [Sclerophora amabilis]
MAPMPQDVVKYLYEKTSFIRDTMRFQTASYCRTQLMPTLNECFDTLDSYDVDVEVLRTTRIHNALREIYNRDNLFDHDVTDCAKMMLDKWNHQFGDTSNIRPDLWGDGGRMEGCGKEFHPVPRQKQKRWHVAPSSRKFITRDGEGDFLVGDWWINRAAAFRDGAIDNPDGRFSYSKWGVCALVLALGEEEILKEESNDDLEISSWKCKMTEFKPGPKGEGMWALTSNMLCGEQTRLLRSWKLTSPLAPTAGLRYDGMYTIREFAVTDEEGVVYFTMELARGEYMLDRDIMMEHPNSEEIDDWEEFRRARKMAYEIQTLQLQNSAQTPLS